MAAIPFAARALVGTLPAAVLTATLPVTLKELVEDFIKQLPQAKDMIVNLMQTGAVTFIIHCKTSVNAEALLHSGLTFRGQVIQMVAASNTQWIKLTRVVYGTTENAIKSRLMEYGNVLKMKQETIYGIGISVYSVKMEIKKPIPSRVTIAHYPVNVFYRGQVQQCFRCEQTGHLSKSCPFRKSVVLPQSRIVGPITETVSTRSDPASSAVKTSTTTTVVAEQSSPPDLTATSSDTTTMAADPPRIPFPVPTLYQIPMSTDPPIESQTTDLSDSSSADSSLTPRSETGKRQRKLDETDKTPSKRDKCTPVTYEEIEREGMRLYALGIKADSSETVAFEKLFSTVPKPNRKKFQFTLDYRHPLLIKDKSRRTAIIDLLQELKLPDGHVDLSKTKLMEPILPSDVPAAKLDYLRYEILRTYVEMQRTFPDLMSLLPAPYQKEIDEMPEETRDGYAVYYSFIHPESLTGISKDAKEAVLAAVSNRTFIDYESS